MQVAFWKKKKKKTLYHAETHWLCHRTILLHENMSSKCDLKWLMAHISHNTQKKQNKQKKKELLSPSVKSLSPVEKNNKGSKSWI